MKKTQELNLIIDYLKKTQVTDITLYNVAPVTPFFDYCIITKAHNTRLASSVINNLRDVAGESGILVKGYSDKDTSNWFLIDMNSIIVHVFVGGDRERYNLDGLYFNLEKEEIES